MADRLDDIRARQRAFVAERDWAQFHDPKNLAMAVASEARELQAEYRWIANAQADAWVWTLWQRWQRRSHSTRSTTR